MIGESPLGSTPFGALPGGQSDSVYLNGPSGNGVAHDLVIDLSTALDGAAGAGASIGLLVKVVIDAASGEGATQDIAVSSVVRVDAADGAGKAIAFVVPVDLDGAAGDGAAWDLSVVGRIRIQSATGWSAAYPIMVPAVEQAAIPTVTVFNSRTGAATEYATGWSDVMVHDGALYGSGASGLHAPDETASDTLAIKIRTGDLLLNGGKPYNLHKVTPLLSADGLVQLTLIPHVRGTPTTVGPFNIELPDRTDQREWPVNTGRGHEGPRYALQWEATGPMTMDAADLYIRPIRRRR